MFKIDAKFCSNILIKITAILKHFEMPISPTAGYHYLTVVDEFGNEIKRKIEVVRD